VAALVRIGALTPWAYRSSAWLSLVLLGVQIGLYTVVWRAIYGSEPTVVAGVDVNTAVGYAVLGLTMASILHTWPGSSIESRVRDGLIGIDLTRPLGLLGQNLAVQTGFVIAALPGAGVGVAVGLLVGGLQSPADIEAGVAFAVSLVLAFAVAQLITLLMSLSSFWTLEVGGLGMTFSVVRMFLSGAIVPLWFMPGWLQGIAAVLPFQASTYTPLAIYFGRPPGGLAVALLVQLGWIVALSALCALVWSRARHRVVVQGG
jgi:ABC-2 type transport system permease protein